MPGAVERAVAGDDLDVTDERVFVVDGDHHRRSWCVDPCRRPEDGRDGAARSVLARMAHADDEAAEVVGQLVERRDGMTYFGVRVGVAVADVVGDRVDD